MCKFPSLFFRDNIIIVVIYHGILTLCRFLIINSYTAQATHYDTESCMFPYLIIRQFQLIVKYFMTHCVDTPHTVHLRTYLVMHNLLHNII